MRLLSPPAVVLWCWLISMIAPVSAQTPTRGDTITVLVVQGTVQIAKSGTEAWTMAKPADVMKPGDRIRTGRFSRAELRISDQTVAPVGESASFTFKGPEGQEKKSMVDRILGRVLFLDHGRAAGLRFRGGVTPGATRGTEFLVNAPTEDRLVITVFDGEVDMATDEGTVTISKMETLEIRAGKPGLKTAVVNAVSEIQWALYYPAVVSLEDIGLSSDERRQFADSLAAYNRGDLLEALRLVQLGRGANRSTAALSVLEAALALSVGRTDEVVGLMKTPEFSEAGVQSGTRAAARALGMVVGAVKGEAPPEQGELVKASEWLAASIARQSRFDLEGALVAARKAVEIEPGFGFGWARVAELEFGFGRTEAALRSVEKALNLSPALAPSISLRGYLLAGQNRIELAKREFERAIEADGMLASAWLGRGLCRIREGDLEAGRMDIQTAAALEPQRAMFRSYLAKAFSQTGRNDLALKELTLSKELDPRDPTAWLYSALIRQQGNEINDAVRDLEESQKRVGNRRIYRSSFLLDQDRAVRSVNLASLYRDAGMTEVSLNEASRAVSYDYGNPSAHLFLAESYDALRDPRQVNLRYESPWLNEFLLANLLSSVGAGTLSQYVSQNEYSKLFERDRAGLVSSTEYQSGGDWRQAASQFGTFGNASYAVDTLYRSSAGERPNQDFEQTTVSAKVKQQLTPSDTVFLQGIYYSFDGGDLAQYYDGPAEYHPKLRVRETQEPLALAGYRHSWSESSHTLFMVTRFEDRQQVVDPGYGLAFFGRNAAGQVTDTARPRGTNLLDTPYSAGISPRSSLAYRSEFTGASVEAQQIWEQGTQTLIGGVRYQSGSFDVESDLGASDPARLGNGARITPIPFSSPAISQSVSPDFERVSIYLYEQWRVIDSLQLTAGLAYDRLRQPLNFRSPPVSGLEEDFDPVSPKVGLYYTPGRNTVLRAAFAQTVGGTGFDQSFKLEPGQISGFVQSYRGLAPESLVGSLSGERMRTSGVGVEHKIGRSTWVGAEMEWLESTTRSSLGAVTFYSPNIFTQTFTPTTIPLRLDYSERGFRAHIDHLVRRDWSLGLRYRLSDAELKWQEEGVPVILDSRASQRLGSVLNEVGAHARLNHPGGFFAGAEAVWVNQSNRGFHSPRPGDDFWHLDLEAGFRFPRRTVEIRTGLLNATDEDYHLSPVNVYAERRHSRTWFASFKFQF